MHCIVLCFQQQCQLFHIGRVRFARFAGRVNRKDLTSISNPVVEVTPLRRQRARRTPKSNTPIFKLFLCSGAFLAPGSHVAYRDALLRVIESNQRLAEPAARPSSPVASLLISRGPQKDQSKCSFPIHCIRSEKTQGGTVMKSGFC